MNLPDFRFPLRDLFDQAAADGVRRQIADTEMGMEERKINVVTEAIAIVSRRSLVDAGQRCVVN